MKRSFIGVGAQDVMLPRRIIEQLELPVRRGVMVVEVEAGSPGDAAGLQTGDVIVGLDHEPVSGIDDLHQLLTEERVGQRLPMEVLRGTDVITVDLVPTDG